ncbi:MAG: dihydroneopterin aldolase [Actinomycetota bacterium]|nr:dihydroneopterin aldolase [Actinomycetota bacterium]
MDSISVKGLRAFGRHGVEEAERQAPQELKVDLVVKLDLAGAGKTDELEATVDYKGLVDDTLDIVSTTSYKLLEALAEHIAASILRRPGVEEVSISIAKAEVPIPAQVDEIRVQICRRR